MCVLIQSGWRDSGLRGSILCRCDAIPDDWIAQALSDAAHIYHLVGWSQQDAGKKRAQPMPVQKTTRVFLYPKLGGRPKEWRKLAGPCLHARAPRRMCGGQKAHAQLLLRACFDGKARGKLLGHAIWSHAIRSRRRIVVPRQALRAQCGATCHGSARQVIRRGQVEKQHRHWQLRLWQHAQWRLNASAPHATR